MATSAVPSNPLSASAQRPLLLPAPALRIRVALTAFHCATVPLAARRSSCSVARWARSSKCARALGGREGDEGERGGTRWCVVERWWEAWEWRETTRSCVDERGVGEYAATEGGITGMRT